MTATQTTDKNTRDFGTVIERTKVTATIKLDKNISVAIGDCGCTDISHSGKTFTVTWNIPRCPETMDFYPITRNITIRFEDHTSMVYQLKAKIVKK